MATPKGRSARSDGPSVKKPCGHCKKECATGNSVPCGFCEFWFHADCVEGMSPEFLASCDAINRLTGGSSFLCVICRKLATKLNGTMRESLDRIQKLEQRLVTAELERNCLTEKIKGIESRNKKVDENVTKIETEVAAGMEKAKEEVKDEMRIEMQARDDIKDNIVLYGVEESKEADVGKNRDEDREKVKKIAAAIEVKISGEIQIRFRAGRKVGDKPRPLIVRIDDAGTRESMLAQARRLSRKEEWKRVYIAPDTTRQQRDDAKREEDKMKEDAERKTAEATSTGQMGKWLVVGPRGKRWTKWVEEEKQANV